MYKVQFDYGEGKEVTVYIVTYWNGTGIIIESVWSTIELARAGILYHAQYPLRNPDSYSIVEREVNVAQLMGTKL